MTAPAIDILKDDAPSEVHDYSINIFKSYYRRISPSGPKHLETNYRAFLMSLALTRSPLFICYLETVGCSFSNKVAVAIGAQAAIDSSVTTYQPDLAEPSFEIVNKAVKEVNSSLYNYALSVKLVGAIEISGFITCFDGRTVSCVSAGNTEGYLGRKNTAYKLAGVEADERPAIPFGVSSSSKHYVTTIPVKSGDMLLFPKYHEGLS